MTVEAYKDLRDKKTTDLDVLYKYFLEEGGMRIPAPAFVKHFKTWCLINFADFHQVVPHIIQWLDQKHEYKTKTK